jgi:YtkA-like protein
MNIRFCILSLVAFVVPAGADASMSAFRFDDRWNQTPPLQTENLKIAADLGTHNVGGNRLIIRVAAFDGKPVEGATIKIDVAMTSMDMGTGHPGVKELGQGRYEATVPFSMAGGWRIRVTVTKDGVTETKTLDVAAESGEMGAMEEMGAMSGKLGAWTMAREASGTSWIPDSSPMFMKMLPKMGDYDVSLMGYFTLNYSSSGGARGDQRFYSNSMPMLMATRGTGGGVLGLNLMMSLDPIFNGEVGYPDLFQTGETAHGTPLVDHQHPHNLLSEVTASYSHPIGGGLGAFVYAGPIGEPSMGGPAFMHRPSGFEIPEAPISHHWFDSTHISSGVITAGLNNGKWQLEGSSFNGQEPPENRYWPQPISFNSASARLTFNPNRDLSFNTSYGFLYSPESTAPGVDQHRLTAAAIWSRPMAHGDNLSTSLLFGRRMQQGTASDAYVLESTYLTGPTSIFVRWENVDEDELTGIPAGNYRVNKVLFGAVRNFARPGGYELGLGAYMGLYSFPASLDPFYGRSPVSLGVFLRLRTGRMP